MLIGDFTGMIGDPTEKTATRKKMSREEVLFNSKNYKKLASKILRFNGQNPCKILYNSKWSDPLSFVDLIELASHFTVQQMIIRDMFQKRIKQKKPIYLHEFLYPVAQAYDSLAMNVDLEVGGKDQTFNMLCGRDLVKDIKGKEKFVLATKLLIMSTGKKMGKTEGNIVSMTDEPKEMYGKIMAWPDSLIALGFELCTGLPINEIINISNQIKEGKLNPQKAKARLAREIVVICHNKKEAKKAEEEFNRVFKEKKLPTIIPKIKLKEQKINILDLLIKIKLAPSKSEAKRLILQKGVKINGETQKDWRKIVQLKKEMVIQVGKRNFVRII
jgi:tyrosyl-tRNA synthetase